VVDYPELNGKTRDETSILLHEWVSNSGIIRHCVAVETAMRAYARHLGEPEDAWGIVGLIHDFDYERHPDLEEHPYVGANVLKAQGYPEWVVRAVLSHADSPAIPRVTVLERTLFAVDELTGFISAVALVRPSKAVADVEVSSVRKKMKDKRFAEGIHRTDLTRGAEELGVGFDQHVEFVIQAMANNAHALGLAGANLRETTSVAGAQPGSLGKDFRFGEVDQAVRSDD
jgi:putative nucleotidyltransferase with HDIG domain